MTRIKLRYVQEFCDRHGRVRRYFRRRGYKSIALPGLPGSTEFMEAYQAALDGRAAPKLEIGADRAPAGTVAAAVADYFKSSAFQAFAPETRRTWRYNLDLFRAQHGLERVSALQSRHVDRMVAAMSGKPAKAHNFLKALRSFMRYCIAENLRKDDPSSGIKGPKFRTDGYRPWGDEQIEKFRAHHPIGTRARLALELLLNVGARRSDAVRLGPQNLENGEFSYRTQKTLTQIDCVPLLPELTEALDAMPNTNSTFLTTHHGKPFTVAGFGNWFRDVCDQAGISKGYSAHGLRKASATRLADHGATEHQLMAWFGWTTLRSAEQYTRAANKRKLNRAAGEMLKIGISNSKRT